MSHQIETHGDKAAAVFGHGKSAWHRLGETVEGALTAEEAMRKAYLAGWNVRKTPLETLGQPVPNHFATVRDNPFVPGQVDVLGVVGTQYQPIQNEAHADFLNALVDESGATFDTAGSLRDGRQTFISMRLPETIRVAGSDALDLNVVGLNSHDGSGAFVVLVSIVRVVCANTQAAALNNHVSKVSIRHTSGATKAVQQAREALGMTFEYAEAFEAEAAKMIDASMTDKAFNSIVADLFPKPKDTESDRVKRGHGETVAALNELWKSSPTMTDLPKSRYRAYQAVTEYTDHYQPVRTSNPDRAAARALRVVTGSDVNALKVKAFNLLSV